ncbi:MAG: CoA pyrophosphatase [Burkholderiaceae bacterium]
MLQLKTYCEHLRPFPSWTPEVLADRGRRLAEVKNPIAAAVLIAILPSPQGLRVLLTRRPESMKDHPGQISFPGGRAEPDDASVHHTALREAAEEVGLCPTSVVVLAQLPDYLTVTGYQVSPVLGLVNGGYKLQADSLEVAELIELPLADVLNPANHERRGLELPTGTAEFFAIPVHGQFIWGATAAIIRNLYHFLYAAWNQRPSSSNLRFGPLRP